ncbi:hypothetical protein Q2T76_04120 [Lactobacillus sp. YT155]|uniref:hypothetical protein n=1 Tax=Lactobacillus sp. YT155 TaxID=3060955 RepID=UPI00265FA6E1|nr:hypothetical protein [Lactobacillus sp. YT155]MDO1605240.1 hypothetical protein [Lactobacillus sp. YT155]
MEQGLSFQTIMKFFKKTFWIFLAFIILGGVYGFIKSTQSTEYIVRGQIYVGQKVDTLGVNNGKLSVIDDKAITSISDLSTSNSFVNEITDKYPDFDVDNLTVGSSDNSNLITVKYKDTKENKDNVKMVNYVMKSLVPFVNKYNDNLQLKQVDKATKKSASLSVLSNKKSKTVMGMLYGVILGFIVSCIYYFFFNNKKNK